MEKNNNNIDKKENNLDFDPAELLAAYSESLNSVKFGNKPASVVSQKKTATAPKDYKEPVENAEHDKMVEQIKEKRRTLSKSVWTDNPLLKPQKSIWLDDDTELKEMHSSPKKPENVAKNVKSEQNMKAEPVKPAMIPQENAKGYDEIIIPITAEFSTSKKLPENPLAKTSKGSRTSRNDRIARAEEQRKKNTEQFKVNIPKNYINEFDRGTDINTRPVKRDEIPKTPPRRVEKPVSVQEQLSDRQKAEEYARQVRRNAQLIRNQESNANSQPNRPSSPNRPQARPVARNINSRQGANVNEQRYKPSTDTKATLAEYERVLLEKKKNEKGKKVAAVEVGYKTHQLEFNFVNAGVCILTVFIVAFTLLVMTCMGKRETESESEKRMLATFPKFSVSSYFKGEFTSGITTYFTDTVPNREKFKALCADFTKCLGVDIGDTRISDVIKKVDKEELDKDKIATTTTVKINTGKVTTTTEDKDKTTTKKSTTEKLIDVPDNLDEGQFLGAVVVSGKGENVRACSSYYGTFDSGDYYSSTINKWKEDLGDSVNVYSMSIPLSGAFYMPSNLKDQMSDQKDNIDNINAGLKGIAAVNVYNSLAEHVDEYIYSRTDHHWQPLGAYYATKVFADIAGVDYPALSEYDKFTIDDFVGTMYAWSDYDQELANYPDTFTYYKPKNLDSISSTYYDTAFSSSYEAGASDASGLFYDYASGSNCYSAILNRDDEIVEIKTACTNDRVLVIFKDSFGNAIVPFLTNSFSKIYVCDFRYFQPNAIEFCKKVGCTDLLFAISLMSCSTQSQVDCISNDRIQ